MGFILSLINTIRKTKKTVDIAKNSMDDPGYAIQLVKQQAKSYLFGILKGIGLEFLGLAVILVVIIAAVGVVFQIFSFLGSDFTDIGNITKEFEDKTLEDMQEMGQDLSTENIEEMSKWAESLSEEELEDLQGFGVSINPKKAVKYVGIEENSYEKNTKIKTPLEKKIWQNGVLIGNSTDYIDYVLKRGDSAYPYRQWWQSTTVLDAINDTAFYEEKMEIVESAEADLKPYFTWHDPKTPSYTEYDKYTKHSGHETEIITTIETKESYSLVRTTGPVNYRSLSLDDVSSNFTRKEEIKEYYPLPNLSSVNTMFANYTFEYKKISDGTNSSYTNIDYVTFTEKRIVNGVEEEVEFEYRIETTRNTNVVVNSYELVSVEKELNDRFHSYLISQDIEILSNPEIMLHMAELLPQNYDFVTEYEEYISYMEMQDIYIDFNGDFGDYTGSGIFSWPVRGNYRISSYFGYRIHPIWRDRRLHTGIDIPAKTGTDVIAAEDGIVIFSGSRGGYGRTIIINHGGGISTLYAHNSSLVVSAGKEVKKGDVIAKIGSTGTSTGAHLHFEVRKNGTPVDPLSWFRVN